jgi:hypothetical protein
MFCIRQLHIGGGTLCEHLITFYYFLLIFPDSNLPFNGSTNYWTGQDDRETVSRHIGVKDQTVLVSLIIMGVVVPAIFTFMFVMLCLKHKRTQQSRR